MMDQELLYPTGQQDFKKIREQGKVYIDKTELIPSLIKKNCVFLSRPRRFGKSLLLSTLRYYFEGEKDLFKGLAIYDLEKDWKKYSVLFLEFSRIDANDPDALTGSLENQFSNWEEKYSIDKFDLPYSQRFDKIIRKVSEMTGQKVVILIDEYDNPLINTIINSEIHERHKELLKSVYSNLKPLDEYIEFAMLTGVSRFSKAGVFSGLNNLNDISFNEEYSTICGFTESEIRKYLWSGVRKLGETEDCEPRDAMQLLKSQYDGYHFAKDLTDVYNPYSLLNCLQDRQISNYWIESGTPTFLVNRLKESDSSFQQIFNEEADTMDLATVDTAFSSPVALLFQTGYLTIKSYEKKKNLYKLGVPNNEVREGFFTVLLSQWIEKDRRQTIRTVDRMRDCLDRGEIQEFLEILRGFFAGISYRLTSKKPEIYFENNLYVIFQLMGHEVLAEDETSWGRIDLTVKTADYIYIFEIKVDKSACEALEQIKKKGYDLKYANDRRQVICVGVNFSSEQRNITDWLIFKV